MTLLQAIVWCFGILIAGVTITSVARSVANAIVRAAIHTSDILKEEIKRDDQNNSQGQ